jgi:cytochrome c-type biogenesis protein CcmE
MDVSVEADLPPARPAPPPPRRLRYLVAGGICLAAVAYLVFVGLSKNIVYFRTVSEAVSERSSEGGARLRMAGAVVAGSVERRDDGVAFELTEGGEVASVLHRGDPPELFKYGAPVVCEGRWQGTTFDSDRIMIKHGSEYRPPDVKPPASTPAS